MEAKSDHSYTIKFNNEEFDLLFNGIGNTSIASRKTSGMSEEQSLFFDKLYDILESA